MSASNECTDTIYMTQECIFDSLISVYFVHIEFGDPVGKIEKKPNYLSVRFVSFMSQISQEMAKTATK